MSLLGKAAVVMWWTIRAGAQETSTAGRYNLSFTMTPLDLAAT
jgi:hypothetical protein